MTQLSDILVKKYKDGYRAEHIPTKLVAYDETSSLLAVFELGREVERQLEFQFEALENF